MAEELLISKPNKMTRGCLEKMIVIHFAKKFPLLCIPTVYYRVHKSPPLDPILS